ncbi:uncharacterized protein L203_101238 [Cryptococcus depauperatus CBS 7841]|uniref:Major facilitator superfamily (MFS) profile domain-containing protein n=1 Tax=Cryptococcus depauperatus CBS 7841 TaxID=1295531 RepID=A0AAJ8LXM1_9TREE
MLTSLPFFFSDVSYVFLYNITIPILSTVYVKDCRILNLVVHHTLLCFENCLMTATRIISTPISPDRVEAPVTAKGYLLCVFASFGGIFLGYEAGYMNGVLGMNYFINMMTGLPIPPHNADKATKDVFTLPSWEKSLITSILSASTIFGAIIAGDLADYFGRRITIISGCAVFILVAGRLISGFGVGFISATITLYMSEIAPRKVRGAIVSGYQFCITIGLLLVSCVCYATQNRTDSGSYRIPIAVQFAWALILGGGLFCLPESPRWYVKRGKIKQARAALSRVRGQPVDSGYIKDEIDEIVANHEYETELIPSETYFSSWAACFSGGFRKPQSNLRRTVLGITLQMMQQWTGINFIFYFSTTFFHDLGTIPNPFLISLIITLVNVCSTPISFWTIEYFGRRPLMIYGAIGIRTTLKSPTRKSLLSNLGSRVFFIWGSNCVLCSSYAYFFVWETKSLTLEQVDRMMEECASPRRSSGWKPHSTFAAEMHHQHEKMSVTEKEKVSEEEGAPATNAPDQMQV